MSRAHSSMPGRLAALLALFALTLLTLLPPAIAGGETPQLRPAQWRALPVSPHLAPGKTTPGKPDSAAMAAVLPSGFAVAPAGAGSPLAARLAAPAPAPRPWRAHGSRAPPHTLPSTVS